MTNSAAGALAPAERERSVLSPAPPRFPVTIDYAGRGVRGPVAQVAVIGRDTVTIRRECEAGVPLYITVPTRAYRGVAISARLGAAGAEVSLRLEHADPDLAVPIRCTADADGVRAEWFAWARALARPLLVEDGEGRVAEVEACLADLGCEAPRARRANRFFAERRPRFLTRRVVGGVANGPVLREDEIIARGVDD